MFNHQHTAIHPATGCTNLPVASCYFCAILNTEAGRMIGAEISHLHLAGRMIATATSKLVA